MFRYFTRKDKKMNNETILQVNEIYQNIPSGNASSDTASIPSLASGTTTNDTGTNSNAPTNNNTESSSNLYSVVSSGDALPSNTAVQLYQETQTNYTVQLEEISETLHGIDSTLIIIMFFILFMWAENKIRNGVRSFAGIGLK